MVQGIVVPSDERAPVEVCEFRSLEDYQTAVDGWIEPIDIPLLGITVYVNEGARRRRMALNSRATLLWWFFTPSARLQVMLMGDVVIAGCLEDEYSAGAVPDDSPASSPTAPSTRYRCAPSEAPSGSRPAPASSRTSTRCSGACSSPNAGAAPTRCASSGSREGSTERLRPTGGAVRAECFAHSPDRAPRPTDDRSSSFVFCG